MTPIDHPCEQRPLRHGEVTVHHVQKVRGLYVALLQLHGPRGPWDYAIATYYPDGTRTGGSAHTTPSRARAEEIHEERVASWLRDDTTPTAADLLEQWSERQRRSA